MPVFRPGDPGYIEPGSTDHLGCSQIANVLGRGYDPLKDINYMWRKMTGRATPTAHKRIFDRGHAMESHIIDLLAADHDCVVEAEQVLFVDPTRPWLIYHADGMIPSHTPLRGSSGEIYPGPGIYEGKAPGSRRVQYFEEQGMTADYVTQGQMGMHVSGAATGRHVRWGRYAFLNYDEWQVIAFDSRRSQSFIDSTLKILDNFWECVQTDTPPEPLSIDDYEPPPVCDGSVVEIDDDDLIALLRAHVKLNDSLTPAKKELDALKDTIRGLLGDTQLGETFDIRASYKWGDKPRRKIDGEGLLHFASQRIPDFDENEFLTISPPNRTLRVTAKK